jgi:hypothetical protein
MQGKIITCTDEVRRHWLSHLVFVKSGQTYANTFIHSFDHPVKSILLHASFNWVMFGLNKNNKRQTKYIIELYRQSMPSYLVGASLKKEKLPLHNTWVTDTVKPVYKDLWRELKMWSSWAVVLYMQGKIICTIHYIVLTTQSNQYYFMPHLIG